jgi:hypothetical protein
MTILRNGIIISVYIGIIVFDVLNTFTGQFRTFSASPQLHGLGWPFCFARAVSHTHAGVTTIEVIEVRIYFMMLDILIYFVLIGASLLGLCRILQRGMSLKEPIFLVSLVLVLLVVAIGNMHAFARLNVLGSVPYVGEYTGFLLLEKLIYAFLGIYWIGSAVQEYPVNNPDSED